MAFAIRRVTDPGYEVFEEACHEGERDTEHLLELGLKALSGDHAKAERDRSLDKLFVHERDPRRRARGRPRALLGIHDVQAAPTRGDGRHPRRPRLGDGAADRRRQVALLPGAGAASRPGWRVVVSPLISLMKDQVDTLVGNGVPAALYNSSLARDEKTAVVAGLRAGRYRLLYVSPERLVGEGSDELRRPPVLVRRAASSRWTRRTASASGATTSGRSTASSAGCASCCRASACTRTRRPPPRACGATSRRSSALRDPLELVGSFDRPNLHLSRAAARRR